MVTLVLGCIPLLFAICCLWRVHCIYTLCRVPSSVVEACSELHCCNARCSRCNKGRQRAVQALCIHGHFLLQSRDWWHHHQWVLNGWPLHRCRQLAVSNRSCGRRGIVLRGWDHTNLVIMYCPLIMTLRFSAWVFENKFKKCQCSSYSKV